MLNDSQYNVDHTLIEQPILPTEATQLREYVLMEELGRGGMGVVYKAYHTKLKRLVALKILHEERMSKANMVARFEREIEVVGRIDHPNIVRATDAGECDGKGCDRPIRWKTVEKRRRVPIWR
ncbi:MAG: protein kinase, partial [Planctomycetota bacterium]|nr:protein kinase [Planctomycetota bacterium]